MEGRESGPMGAVQQVTSFIVTLVLYYTFSTFSKPLNIYLNVP